MSKSTGVRIQTFARFALLTMVLAVAGIVPGVAQDDDLPRPEPEDSRTQVLRAMLEQIHDEHFAQGVALDRCPTLQQIDRENDEDLARLHQILLKITTKEKQKLAVVLVLPHLGRTESVYPLMLTMNDPAESLRTRGEILKRIGDFEDDRVIIPVANTLRSKETVLHPHAARALSKFGDNIRARRYFRTLVVAGNPSTRGWGVRALGWSGWEEGPAILLDRIRLERHVIVRGRLHEAMADMGVLDGIGFMVEDLDAEDDRLQAMAAESIGKMGYAAADAALEKMLEVVEDEDESVGVRGTVANQIPRVAPRSDDAALRLAKLIGEAPTEFDMSIKVALRWFASRALMEELIKIMSNSAESDERRQGAYLVLRAITGLRAEADPGQWRSWWMDRKDRYAFPNHARDRTLPVVGGEGEE